MEGSLQIPIRLEVHDIDDATQVIIKIPATVPQVDQGWNIA